MNYRELKKIDTKLNKIVNKLSFTVVNPLNADKEKEIFFSRKEYNPVFKYQRYRSRLDILKGKLEDIKADESIFGAVLEQKRLRYLKRILMIKNLGKDEFTERSVDLYGKPSKELVEKAKGMLTIQIEEQKPTLTTEEVMSFLRAALEEYGISNWNLVEKDMPAMAAVSSKTRRLYVKKDALFSKDFLDRLVVHEIGTHVLRTENGFKQPFKIFSTGLPNYLLTEEGLAVVNEERTGHLNKGILHNYVGRVIAVDIASRGSFNDVFKELSKYFIAESAFKIALRAKRGVADTSNPGGLTKDYLYLDGYFKIKEYLEKGGDLKKLYYGKIGLEQTPLLKDIPRLRKPVFLPKFY